MLENNRVTENMIDKVMEKEMKQAEKEVSLPSAVAAQMATIGNLAKSVAEMASALSVKPDLVRNIKTFHAEKDLSGAIEWLDSLTLNAELFKWNDETKLAAARAHLANSALNWYSTKEYTGMEKSWNCDGH